MNPLLRLAACALILASLQLRAMAASSPLPHATFPASEARQVCPDTPLRLTFDGVVGLGTSGKIHVIDAATRADVDTFDVAAPVASQTIGGEPNFRYFTVIASGRDVTLFPKHGALAYGHRYAVTCDAGAFTINGQPSAAVDAAVNWTFTTKASPPPSGATRLTVAADGTGDFCTVQGALDYIPDGNTTPTTITIRKGLYTEIIFFTNKHGITLRGEDRQQTVIAYATNNTFNPTVGNPFGEARPNPAQSRHVYHRGVFLAHRANDLVLTNLTIRNTTPQGGSQAEAIILNGTPTSHAVIKDVDLYSYQDTLQINGQAYLENCYIEGDVDFMWGTGPCYFSRCVCRALRSGAYYTQVRNPKTNRGFVYVDCVFDGIQGVMGNYVSRVGTGRFPHSEVVLLDCLLTPAVGPVGWQFLGGREGNERDPAQVHFWEFNSHDGAGQPVNTELRRDGSRQLTKIADATVIGQYRDPAFVLGGWKPSVPPPTPPSAAAGSRTIQILVQPASQLALLGTSPILRVAAAVTEGAPPTFQWCKNGQPLAGETAASLRIASMRPQDAGVYTAIVRSDSAWTTSAPARVTAVAPQTAKAPDLPRITSATFDVTQFGARGDGTTDNTAALQKALDAAAHAGGGTVVLPAAPKPYLSGPLTLDSGVNLEVASGARLQALPYGTGSQPGTYPLEGKAYANFLSASNAHDIAITGGGVIDGAGEPWWAAFRANRNMPHRPYLVRFSKCERVLVSGVTFTRSPMFHVAINADHLTVFGITVDTPEAPNTDGVDPSGSHQLFQNCAISCGDDNIVMKPGGAFCSDITIADCAFGEGHGLSVGGQTNRGLDGMVVKNCSFTGTTSGLRLKADPTQGGEVKNISYANLSMDRVQYPIVFYSYYNRVGNPGSISGSNRTTPEKVRAWNTTPPNALTSETLPSWKNITVSNLTATGTKGYSIVWGLPLEGFLIDNVKFADVRILGGPGFAVFDATNIQFTGDSDPGQLIVANAVVVTKSPAPQQVAAGGTARFSVGVVGPGTDGGAVAIQWTCNGMPLADGAAGGATISGATTPELTITGVTPGAVGKYAAVISSRLDGHAPASSGLTPRAIPVSFSTSAAALTIADATRP